MSTGDKITPTVDKFPLTVEKTATIVNIFFLTVKKTAATVKLLCLTVLSAAETIPKHHRITKTLTKFGQGFQNLIYILPDKHNKRNN